MTKTSNNAKKINKNSCNDEETSNENRLNDHIEDVEELSNENSVSPENANTIKTSSTVSRFLKDDRSSTPLNVKLKLQVFIFAIFLKIFKIKRVLKFII